MNEFRELFLQFCSACVLAAVLRLFFPSGSQKAVINGVLTLYIVAAVLPWNRFGFPADLSWEHLTSSEEVPSSDLTEYADQLYLSQVEAQLAEALAERGIPAQLTITKEGNCLVSANGEQWEQMQQVIREAGWDGAVLLQEQQP